MSGETTKGPKRLERHFKGVSNHRRIQILLLVAKKTDLNLVQISDEVRANMKTVAEHVRRLVIAGLVEKRFVGRDLEHKLTPYGRMFVQFIEKFSKQ